MERDPHRVRCNVVEGYVSLAPAGDVYGVALAGRVDDELLVVDEEATVEDRRSRAVR